MQAILGKSYGVCSFGVAHVKPCISSSLLLVAKKSVACAASGNSNVHAIVNGAGGLMNKSTATNCNRFYTTSSVQGSTPQKQEPEKSVFISQSADIHTNLALEDWIYRNFNFEKHRVLLLWRNEPCVVIGRHQNPWTEVDVAAAEESKVTIARRNSGGGCVFHDKGNLNCTFFTPRADYDRTTNLEIICRALKRQFGIQAEINPKQDVTVHGYKVSGTAAKLGKNAYHHLTVLVNADLKKLTTLLNPDTKGLDSRATKSIKSPVENLKNVEPSMSVEKVLSAVGYEFLRTDKNGNDGGKQMIEKQRGFQMVNPTNEWFPGLDSIRAEFKNWSWNYGKTPEFSVDRTYPIGLGPNGIIVCLQLRLQVSKGLIESVKLELPSDQSNMVDSTTSADLSAFINAIKGRQFHMGILSTFEGLLSKNNNPIEEKSGLQ